MTTRLLKNPPKIRRVNPPEIRRVNPPKMFQLDRTLRDYTALKARVHEVLILGRERIEQEFMRMRYDTGLLINEHVRLNEAHAGYGTQAIEKLGKDMDFDVTELRRFAQFAAAFPIRGGRRELGFNLPWTHYRKLMIVKDDARRWELALEAEKKGWSFEEVEARVRYAVGKDGEEKEPSRLPFVCLGPFFTYKIIRPETIHSRSPELLLDLGFGQALETALFPKARFGAETIVTAGPVPWSLVRAEGAEEGSLYTYKAYVERVIDGDTLKVEFQLGFGSRKREIIRLNHIDCPELSTPEGQAAKRFVESELSKCESITVKSVKTRKEKWGRYLGDVFYTPARDIKIPAGSTRSIGSGYEKPGSARPVYLNQLLIDQGHAVALRS